MKALNKEEIKELQIKMLKEFVKICDEYHLYYTLCGGTLLGAIRHKGFIPWDDDIDVAMPRKDFEKLCFFVRENKLSLPKHLKFVSWFTDIKTYVPFLKIIDLRTCVQEDYMITDNYLWIDILCMDGCPKNDNEVKKLFIISKILRKILFIKQSRKHTGKTMLKAMLKDVARIIFWPIKKETLCKMIDNNSKRYNFDDYNNIAISQWGYGPQERINKNKWLSPIKVNFEGLSLNAPENYNEYLSNLYGDYMKLPPEEKRTSHNMMVMMNE